MKTIKIQFITVFICVILAVYSLSKALFNLISQILLIFVKGCLWAINDKLENKELTEQFIEVK